MSLDTSPRPTTDEQRVWLRQQPWWFCEKFRLSNLPRRRRIARNKNTQWYHNMAADVAQNGLRNPILLNNMDTEHPQCPFPDERKYAVIAGNHRIMAVKDAGLDRIPALIFGEPPQFDWSMGPLTRDEANAYLQEGEITYAWHGPRLIGVQDPKEVFK